MVKKHAALLLCLFAAAVWQAGAQTAVSGSVDFGTGVLFSQNDPLWFASGGAKITVETGKRDAVKALVSISLNGQSLPFASVDADTLYASQFSLSLDRAYVKFRLPWFIEDSSLRVSIGKQPVSWGKGFYFNAADIVFGPVPSASSLIMDEYRTGAKWAASVYMPFGDFTFIEFTALPPWYAAIAQSGGVMMRSGGGKTAEKGRVGGRAVLAPGWMLLDSVETDYLYAPGDGSHQLSLTLDGIAWADYNAGISFCLARNPVKDIRDTLALSLALFRMFTIPAGDTSLTLSVRAESLCYPFVTEALFFPSVTLGITSELSIAGAALISAPKLSAQTALSVIWKPFSGIQLSVSGWLRADDPSQGGGVSVSANCKF